MHKRFWVSGVSLGLCPSTAHTYEGSGLRGAEARQWGAGGVRDECEECRVLGAMKRMDWGEPTGSDMERQETPL